MTELTQKAASKDASLPRFGKPAYRTRLWDALDKSRCEWDLVIIGGGITGAGILREAARFGWRTLLIERQDFAAGTSSKSSKMVHGGLRYLASGQFGLTRDSVSERERLLQEAPGLVEPLPFLMPHYRGEFPPPFLFGRLLDVYDGMANLGRSKGRAASGDVSTGGATVAKPKPYRHRCWSASEATALAYPLRMDRLKGLTQFADAVTDDARLVWRVLQESLDTQPEACVSTAALSYVAVNQVVASEQGYHVRVSDQCAGKTLTIRTRAVVHATGAWSRPPDQRAADGESIRPLRGSHLVLSPDRLPLAYAVSFLHPQDKRPVFAFPWEGTTVIGTTDLDHRQDLQAGIAIGQEEIDYLLKAVNQTFPGLHLGKKDVISTWSGIRPVVSRGKGLNPSKEKREHTVWQDGAEVTIAGGKLTTFRLIALEVLERLKPYLPEVRREESSRIFDRPQADEARFPHRMARRWMGYYGARASEIPAASAPLTGKIPGTPYHWEEIFWQLLNEQIVFLDDWLLRRNRLGLLLADGAAALEGSLKRLCQEALDWSDAYWDEQWQHYRAIYRREFSLPGQAAIS